MFRPLAYTVISGLMYSTILTMFVVPSLYMVIARWKLKRKMVKASFYKYFQSKEELLLGTIDLIEKLLDTDIKELYLKHQLSPREKLRQLYLIALGRIYKNKIHLLVYSVPLIGSKEVSSF